MPQDEFIRCSKCGFQWESRETFLSDPAIQLVGYQVHFEMLLEGLFMFNHRCGTTLSLCAGKFRSLYDGQVFEGCLLGKLDCPGYCLYETNLLPCPVQCECAFVRDILQVIKQWPKTPGC